MIDEDIVKGKILEVSRICGECWQEDRKIVPMFDLIEAKDNIIIETHNHRVMKIKEEILNALEE